MNCVDSPLNNVCPNCGGGFVARPIRPQTEHREGISRNHQPPSSEAVHSRYSRADIAQFVKGVKDVLAKQR